MGAMSPTHWLIVIGVLVLLFGAKKLPQMARSVGQSARVLKGEMKGLREDEKADEQATAAAPAEVEAAPESSTTQTTQTAPTAQAAQTAQTAQPAATTSDRPAA